MEGYRLNFELVPDSCWGSNLRTLLPKGVWDRVRRAAYARAGGRCAVCGRPAKRLEAHERWAYDEETRVQRLEDVVAVCHACHEVIHIGRTTLLGRERQACAHFCRVNGCTYTDYRRALGEADEANARRSTLGEWSLDVSKLPDLLSGE